VNPEKSARYGLVAGKSSHIRGQAVRLAWIPVPSLEFMPDTPMASEEMPTDVPAEVVDGLKQFTAAHDGATAVIEHVGRRGARIVLVGTDGAFGEAPAPATDVARAACQAAGVTVENGWDRELTENGGDDAWLGSLRRSA
jgi:hypothetical protein